MKHWFENLRKILFKDTEPATEPSPVPEEPETDDDDTGFVTLSLETGPSNATLIKDIETMVKLEPDTAPAVPEVESEVEISDPLKPWPDGMVLLGDYVVERMLGQGGMGRVYLARRISDSELFAIKSVLTMILKDPAKKKLFFRELRTWIDLPPHPHLTACRFFRTVEDKIAIFSEFVDGGSLKEWIRDKKLLNLDTVLDVAIQFAWGLDAAHTCDVVHKDIKPANILLTLGGQAKITDFGLAKMMEFKGGQEAEENLGVRSTAVYMTAAYCSPEQSLHQQVDYRSDIWSYGVSILEIFIGSARWYSGSIADEILESYMNQGGCIEPFPAMPAGMADILGKCLEPEPVNRWQSMADVADALVKLYKQLTGKHYHRLAPKLEVNPTGAGVVQDRRTADGTLWDDPETWIRKAREAAGQTDDPEMKADEMTVSRKALALVDLERFEEAERIFADLVSAGRQKHRSDLAGIFTQKALIQKHIDDTPGARLHYEKAIAIWKDMVYSQGRFDVADDLAGVHMQMAHIEGASGNYQAALDNYDISIRMRQDLIKHVGRDDLQNALIQAYMGKAIALWYLGRTRESLELYDEAIAIREKLVADDGGEELANDLAALYMNKAAVMRMTGDLAGAITLCDKAITIRENLVFTKGREEFANSLTMVYATKAAAASSMGDRETALELYRKTIEMREKMVYEEGRVELANRLAVAYVNMAQTLQELERYQESADLQDKAIEMLEQLTVMEGRKELENDLVSCYISKAILVLNLQNPGESVTFADRAIALLDRLIHTENRKELTTHLAKAYQTKASALSRLPYRGREAPAMFDSAIELYQRLVVQEEKANLSRDLAMTCILKAEHMMDGFDKRPVLDVLTIAVDTLETYRDKTQTDLLPVLAQAKSMRAGVLLALGDREQAESDAGIAVQILEEENRRNPSKATQKILDQALETMDRLAQ